VHSSIQVAYTGLKAQMDALDTLANNLANANAAGFKEQKSFFTTFNRMMESPGATQLEAAINNEVSAGSALNLTDGSLLETRRDLDVALSGNGFFTVETPAGVRYTRNGSLTTNAKSELCTADGFPVLGERGRIVLNQGKVTINQDGEILVDDVRVDRLKLAAFDDRASLLSEGNLLFAPALGGQAAKPASGVVVRQGYQEQSNVNPMLATVRMVEILRHFEAIQKSISLMFNDMDAKAIERLGR
jgi:flagellar basal-body rod protein FlgF